MLSFLTCDVSRQHGPTAGESEARVMHAVQQRSSSGIDKMDGTEIDLHQTLAAGREHVPPALLDVRDSRTNQLSFQSKNHRVLFLFNRDPEHANPGGRQSPQRALTLPKNDAATLLIARTLALHVGWLGKNIAEAKSSSRHVRRYFGI
jgi:hypothetical protein